MRIDKLERYRKLRPHYNGALLFTLIYNKPVPTFREIYLPIFISIEYVMKPVGTRSRPGTTRFFSKQNRFVYNKKRVTLYLISLYISTFSVIYEGDKHLHRNVKLPYPAYGVHVFAL